MTTLRAEVGVAAMMTLQEAAALLGLSDWRGDGALPIARVHSDTRTLQPGDLFVALRGERFDAHDFLLQARHSGAVAALAERGLEEAGLPGLVVPDTLSALGRLAAAWRARFTLPLVAVTGSNGKTTVTQMVAAIMRTWRPEATLATQGNLNNAIGVPLTLLRLRTTHELAVVELGMNHPGEIGLLAAMAQPTVALVNNAQREHQEFMASVEAVARENGAVITALPLNGTVVLPADDDYTSLWQALAGTRTALRFALDHPAADVSCAGLLWRDAAWQVQALTPQGRVTYRLALAGRHNVKNSLAALACAVAAGVPVPVAAAALEAFVPVSGRSRAMALHLQGRPLTLVDDSYNANPDSVLAAIDMLADLPAPRLLVLGDMGEVGAHGPAFHTEMGRRARERGIEGLLGLGELSAHTVKAFGTGQHFGSIEELLTSVRSFLPDTASVLVKGSRFMKMERVVTAITAQADAAKEVSACS